VFLGVLQIEIQTVAVLDIGVARRAGMVEPPSVQIMPLAILV
jgi:hypothetical protein